MSKHDILESSFEETLLYLKKLNTSKHFEHLARRYVKLHNQNIFVDFSFNSSDAKGLFGHFVHRHNLDESILTNVNPNFTRMKKVKINDIQKRLENNRKQMKESKNKTQKVEREFSNMKRELNQQKLLTSNHSSSVQFIERCLELENQMYSLYQEKVDGMLEGVQNIRKLTRSASKSAEYLEQQLFIQVLKYYMNSVEKYLKELFQTPFVYVSFNRKNWVEKFEQNRKTYNFYGDDDLNTFEKQLMNVLFNNKSDFDVTVITETQRYVFSKTALQTYRKNIEDTHTIENSINKIEAKLDDFNKRNLDFYLILQASLLAKEGISEMSVTHYSLNNYLFKQFPKELIEEYNSIIAELRKEREKRDEWLNKRWKQHEPLASIQDYFSNIQFNMGKKLDWAYKVGLNEDRYNDIILSIESEDYLLQFEVEEE